MLVYQRAFLSLWIRSVSIRPLPKESYIQVLQEKLLRQGTNSWVCSCTKCLTVSRYVPVQFIVFFKSWCHVWSILSTFFRISREHFHFVLGLNCRIFWDLLKMSREPGIWQQWTCCPYRFPISCMALEPGQNEPMQISTTLRIIRKTYLFIYGSLNWPDVSLCFIICHYCSLFLCPIILYVH